ncbi:MAG: rhomboid family intramembrane serine protease [Candidatus Tectomicrobia bacterium]|nr:rhomboid family intramembrane serine protease [Candidatus Tectomicrobia bacterium]
MLIPLKDHNPTRTNPFVTIAIILSNAVVFFYQLSLGGRGSQFFVYQLGVIPYEVTHFTDVFPPALLPLPLTLVSAMFLHGGFTHIASNMLYLWVFGNNIEDSMGHAKFVLFYLVCGIIASVTHILADPGSKIPMIGASGAIAGVLGAYIVLYPRAYVSTLFIYLFIRVIDLPASLILGFWILIQLLYATMGGGGGVAWYAHIGGFFAGALLIRYFARKPKRFLDE